MTTEEKNRVVAEFMGFRIGHYPSPKYPVVLFPNNSDDIFKIDSKLRGIIDKQDYAVWKGIDVEFDTSWDWIMPVWHKLRGELLEITTAQRVALCRYIERAIAKDTDITTAFDLITEAILLISKK
jgi:hypothetical protein